jgi:hypothetical protein
MMTISFKINAIPLLPIILKARPFPTRCYVTLIWDCRIIQDGVEFTVYNNDLLVAGPRPRPTTLPSSPLIHCDRYHI